MKTRLLVTVSILLLVALCVPASAESSLSTYIGGAFYRFQESYLLTGLTYLATAQNQMELNITADFGITTVTNTEGQTLPRFYIPVSGGINFTFPGDPLTFFFGTGMSPVFLIAPGADDPFTFLLGPYAKTGVRLRVHEIMSVLLEVQQDLLFGGPKWVNTSTKVIAGIKFSLASSGGGS